MRAAVDEVIGSMAVNTVARENGIDRMTLKRYVRKVRLNANTACKPHYISTQVVQKLNFRTEYSAPADTIAAL